MVVLLVLGVQGMQVQRRLYLPFLTPCDMAETQGLWGCGDLELCCICSVAVGCGFFLAFVFMTVPVSF
jgi:hypothetical protein